MTWIKICGTTSREDAALAVEAGADAVGLIFAPSRRQITPQSAREIARDIPATVERIGVFVNEAPGRIIEVAAEVGLSVVQLHGDEDAAYIHRLRTRAGGEAVRLRVFKALAISGHWGPQLREFLKQDLLDAVLLDSPAVAGADCRGGTGTPFDWERAAEVLQTLSVGEHARVVAGGGLSPDNVRRAISTLEPWGVDVCSGVEREPGIKDPQKVKAFVAAVRAAAAHQV